MKQNSYVVATIKSWNIDSFEEVRNRLPGAWHIVTTREALNVEWLEKVNPRYIFFPHWSWIVPDELLYRWECVCFHMADVPYGRGGSPLQNLIVRGHKTTKLTALRMVKDLDAGPVYKKIDLSLEGSAQEIFERMAPKIYDLALYIVENEPEPIEQSGDVTLFKRRTPQQSKLPEVGDLKDIYDHIRMLDADSYPKACIEHGQFKLILENATLSSDGKLMAQVHISRD